MRKKRADIVILADTRLSKDIENQVKAEWRGHAIFSSFNSQSRGVVIFINKDLPAKILYSFNDTGGNIAAVLIEIEGKRVLIEGIYGPNQDVPSFYADEVFKRLTTWNPSFAVYVGDWNLALNPQMDTLNYQQVNNPKARDELLEKMEENDLFDVFRTLHPTEHTYSWK